MRQAEAQPAQAARVPKASQTKSDSSADLASVEGLAQLRAMADSSAQANRLRAHADLADRSQTKLVQGKWSGIQQRAIQAKYSSTQASETQDVSADQITSESEAGAQLSTPASASPSTDGGLPAQLKAGIESLSGMSMDHVRVHYNSDKPAQLHAHAYAQGSEIHVAPGQEQHLPHEAWHVVQQAQGRVAPTTQLKKDSSAVVQREGSAEDLEAWRVANHVYGNMPLDAGHITGGILKKIALFAKYRDANKRKRMEELSSEKAHMIEKNMYGRGKIGAVMRNIDTASRIMHLIGSIASVVALAANIAAFFAPAALPVGAVAGVVALAAHAAMAVLQIILIGRNLYRLRGLSEPERAKILPTLYRDCAKLGFALLGVITGGVGLGSAMQSGGLMAQHAMHGAEAAAHGGHMLGDAAGETIGTYGMASTIAYQNEKENRMGMEGRLALPEHAEHGPAPAQVDDPHPNASIAAEMQQDVASSSEVVLGIEVTAQDALGGADGLQADAQPLIKLSDAEAQAQQVLSASQIGEEAIVSMPEGSEAELQAKQEKVDKMEDALGLPKVEDPDSASADKEDAVQKKAKEGGASEASATVQRAGDESPGLLTRAANWLKRKFSSFKKRAKRAFASLRQKLTEMVLKMAGVKNLPLELGDALTEQRADAKQVIAAAGQAKLATAEWKTVADQIDAKK